MNPKLLFLVFADLLFETFVFFKPVEPISCDVSWSPELTERITRLCISGFAALNQYARQPFFIFVQFNAFVCPILIVQAFTRSAILNNLAGLCVAILQIPIAVFFHGPDFLYFGFHFHALSPKLFPKETVCDLSKIYHTSLSARMCYTPSNILFSKVFLAWYYLIIVCILYDIVALIFNLKRYQTASNKSNEFEIQELVVEWPKKSKMTIGHQAAKDVLAQTVFLPGQYPELPSN